MNKKILYLAYGSNLNLSQMAIRCPGAGVIGKTELRDYELVFRGRRHNAVATIEPKKGGVVPVLLWKIDRGNERALDRYEGYPRLYGKHWEEVPFEGEMVSAMVYRMNPGYAYGIPADDYADTIWEGYEEAGFPTQILENAINESYDRAVRQEIGNGQSPSDSHGWGLQR